MPEFLRKVRAYPSDAQTHHAIILIMLTGVRINELLQARWDEFDLEGRKWDIPEERMKNRLPHRVPLTDMMIDELQYWNHFIIEKCTTFFGVPSTNIRHTSIELLPIYRSKSEYTESFLLIRAKEKNAHHFILETLIKFIVYRDLFQLDSQKDVPKVLLKGSKTTNDNSSNPKN